MQHFAIGNEARIVAYQSAEIDIRNRRHFTRSVERWLIEIQSVVVAIFTGDKQVFADESARWSQSLFANRFRLDNAVCNHTGIGDCDATIVEGDYILNV